MEIAGRALCHAFLRKRVADGLARGAFRLANLGRVVGEIGIGTEIHAELSRLMRVVVRRTVARAFSHYWVAEQAGRAGLFWFEFIFILKIGLFNECLALEEIAFLL